VLEAIEAIKERVLDGTHLSDLPLRLQDREAERRAAAEKRIPKLRYRLSIAETAMEGPTGQYQACSVHAVGPAV
jgi:hypothetical protein